MPCQPGATSPPVALQWPAACHTHSYLPNVAHAKPQTNPVESRRTVHSDMPKKNQTGKWHGVVNRSEAWVIQSIHNTPCIHNQPQTVTVPAFPSCAPSLRNCGDNTCSTGKAIRPQAPRLFGMEHTRMAANHLPAHSQGLYTEVAREGWHGKCCCALTGPTGSQHMYAQMNHRHACACACRLHVCPTRPRWWDHASMTAAHASAAAFIAEPPAICHLCTFDCSRIAATRKHAKATCTHTTDWVVFCGYSSQWHSMPQLCKRVLLVISTNVQHRGAWGASGSTACNRKQPLC